ncbi:MAG TPA: carbohydrate ABC transporter permease [Chloroflexota bacterium]
MNGKPLGATLRREAVPGALVLLALIFFASPMAYLVLTALRPASEVFYVLQGQTITFGNFAEAWSVPFMADAFRNSAVIATTSTALSLLVTVPSGYLLARFAGRLRNSWFVVIYLVRTVPYIAWILPLFLIIQSWGLYDTFLGVLIPHVAVHITFFSWIMRGFFEGVPTDLEEAAQVDGCSRWGAFLRIVLPQAIPGMMALGILGWLWSWSEFLFALILTSYNTPLVTVLTAQFVHELGIQWNLMAATSVMAMLPPILAVTFAQRYIVAGLRL